MIGLSGGQGSGKSTIAQILSLILKLKYGLNTVIFSIDDFYKTLRERKKISKEIHSLFLTRGVPGTHNTKLLLKTIKCLKKKRYKLTSIPRFDKSIDDRMAKNKWRKILQKPHIIIFEGWCVGTTHQQKINLKKPINNLEKKFDKKMIWRNSVNNSIKNSYRKIFSFIDKLIFLQVPSFSYVYKWRLLQENKLKLLSKGKKIMTAIKIKNFIMHYERITRHMIKDLKYEANVVIKLDKKHRLNNIKFN